MDGKITTGNEFMLFPTSKMILEDPVLFGGTTVYERNYAEQYISQSIK